VRGLGTGVDARAAAPELAHFECRPFLLWRKCPRLMWCATAEPVCWVWGVLVLAGMRGLGTGVDVGAAAPELSVLSDVPFCLGGSIVDSCGAQP
jgi:hypothetical protein